MMRGSSFAELVFLIGALDAATTCIALAALQYSESSDGLPSTIPELFTMFLVFNFPCSVWDAVCSRSKPAPYLLRITLRGVTPLVVVWNTMVMHDCDRLVMTGRGYVRPPSHRMFGCLILFVHAMLCELLQSIGSGDLAFHAASHRPLLGSLAMPPPGPYPKTKDLVTAGLWAYVRNPMAIFLVLSLAAHAYKNESICIAIYTLCFIAVMTFWFKFFEEPELLERFGEEYKDYCENVPRWIPRSTPYMTNWA